MPSSLPESADRGRVVAVVQTRLGSTRLPGKALADLGGRPLLAVLLDRLRAATTLDEVVVATTQDPADDAIEAVATEAGVRVVRGSTDDVLSRFVAATVDAGTVVRVTGDCPLVDPALIDELVTVFRADAALDYLALGPSWPEGADAEVFSKAALDDADRGATSAPDREHVTLWIKHAGSTRMRLLERAAALGHVRLTVDEPEDLDVLRELVDKLGAAPATGIEEYAELYLATGLAERNGSIGRNEGLWRSQNLADLEQVKRGQTASGVRSAELLQRAHQLVPGGTQTLSKGIDQFVKGVTPAFLERGSGCHVWDVDGNAYIDYPMALGPIMLGYDHPATVDAVRKQMGEGTVFTLPHRLEVEVAERVIDMVPAAEMVRFAKNGSDATSAAIRLARAVTGRDEVAAGGYHGWHDWYVGLTERRAGVPEAVRSLTSKFTFNDVDSFEAAMARNPAAIILELPAEDPAPGFLEHVRRRCTETGTVFIWDEIVTGFRWGPGGAQEYYGVTPDLACLGKAIANGLPLAVIAGSAELMKGFSSVFFSGTFGGETLSLAAAKATLDEIGRGVVCPTIWERGARFRQGLSAAIAESGLPVDLIGHPPRSAFVFKTDGQVDMELRGLFLQETVRRGILFGGPVFVTWAHEDADLDYTVEVVAQALGVLREAVETDSVAARLDGPPPGVVFRPQR
jgi:glutamate-1-semialdehyde aminotransferase/spore coat polysaccharide biosynthesis protein SpsF (cytidylyltransferase family)